MRDIGWRRCPTTDHDRTKILSLIEQSCIPDQTYETRVRESVALLGLDGRMELYIEANDGTMAILDHSNSDLRFVVRKEQVFVQLLTKEGDPIHASVVTRAVLDPKPGTGTKFRERLSSFMTRIARNTSLGESVIDSQTEQIRISSTQSIVRFGNDIRCIVCKLPEDACPICLDGIPLGPVSLTKCQHCFHAACLKEWLTMNDSCPICREQLY